MMAVRTSMRRKKLNPPSARPEGRAQRRVRARRRRRRTAAASPRRRGGRRSACPARCPGPGRGHPPRCAAARRAPPGRGRRRGRRRRGRAWGRKAADAVGRRARDAQMQRTVGPLIGRDSFIKRGGSIAVLRTQNDAQQHAPVGFDAVRRADGGEQLRRIDEQRAQQEQRSRPEESFQHENHRYSLCARGNGDAPEAKRKTDGQKVQKSVKKGLTNV